jgi:hypothetical protein
MSNTVMLGSFPRQLILTIDAVPDDDICTGTRSKFTVLLKTILYTTDSLAGYEIDISYDTSKVVIDQALKVKTMSNKIPSSNFFFRIREPGIASVIGFLNYNEGYLNGDSILVVLTGFWKNPLCTDSTNLKIADFIPAFEFGTEDRPVVLNNKCILFNRKKESLTSTIELSDTKGIEDSIVYERSKYDTSYTVKVKLDKYAGNSGIKLIAKQFIPSSTSRLRANVVSQENTVFTISKDSTEIEIRKIDKYKTALLDVNFIITEEIKDTLTISKWLLYTEGLKCDCLVINDTSILSLALYRKNKLDTIINSAHEEYIEQEMCTDFYDVMGRFIETDCNESKAIPSFTKRRKALKIGTNLIKYIE